MCGARKALAAVILEAGDRPLARHLQGVLGLWMATGLEGDTSRAHLYRGFRAITAIEEDLIQILRELGSRGHRLSRQQHRIDGGEGETPEGGVAL